MGGYWWSKVENFDPTDPDVKSIYYYTTVKDERAGTVRYAPIGTFVRIQSLRPIQNMDQYYFSDAEKPLVVDEKVGGVNELESKLYVRHDD